MRENRTGGQIRVVVLFLYFRISPPSALSWVCLCVCFYVCLCMLVEVCVVCVFRRNRRNQGTVRGVNQGPNGQKKGGPSIREIIRQNKQKKNKPTKRNTILV